MSSWSLQSAANLLCFEVSLSRKVSESKVHFKKKLRTNKAYLRVSENFKRIFLSKTVRVIFSQLLFLLVQSIL